MRRIGIVGIENSHTDHFIRHLNTENRYPGTRLVAVVRGEADRTARLTESGSIDVADSSADLAGLVDAAIVCTRDGALHLAHAAPLIMAGLPVLIDKPLAAGSADARALIEAAAAARVPLVSASAVRFVGDLADVKMAAAENGPGQVVSVLGPADPDSEYSGLTFYGIHVVETALELTGDGEFGPVSVHRGDAGIVATTVINNVVTTMTFVTPDDEGRVPFHAMVLGRHGLAARDLGLSADYNVPLLEVFLRSIEEGHSPMSAEALLRPVQLLEEIAAGLSL